jgi:hypothetical protein
MEVAERAWTNIEVLRIVALSREGVHIAGGLMLPPSEYLKKHSCWWNVVIGRLSLQVRELCYYEYKDKVMV